MGTGMEIITHDLRTEIAQTLAQCGEVGIIVIDSPETEQTASNMLHALAELRNKIRAVYKKSKDKAYAEHKAITEAEKKTLTPLAEAEKALRHRLSNYAMEKRLIRLNEEKNARRVAQAEIKRQTLEAMRLKAEEKKAIAEGDMAKAEELAKAAQDCMDEADAIEIVAGTITVPMAPTAKGIRYVKDYTIDDVDYEQLPCLVMGTQIVKLDTQAVLKLIKASNGTIKIPGIKYTEYSKVIRRG